MMTLSPIIEKEQPIPYGASFKVFGIGGAGCNAVNSMAASQEFSHVEFMVANTDAQSLHLSQIKDKIQLGTRITKGLGAGSNPDTGRRAAEEDLDTIIAKLTGTDILFLTAGFGGGTGSGGLPVVAHAARELGILTVAIVTKPFLFEGKRRQRLAEEAIAAIKNKVDTLIVVPNQRLLEIADPQISMLDAFALSNTILKNAVKGISDIITKPGHINVDFADVKTIMKDMGLALMGTGSASGTDRARHAALNAINSPLLESVSIAGARGVLINITGNKALGLQEINDAATLVYDLVSEDATIILGSVIDDSLKDEVIVTVIATGCDPQAQLQDHATIAQGAKPSLLVSEQQEIVKISDSSKNDTSLSNIFASDTSTSEKKNVLLLDIAPAIVPVQEKESILVCEQRVELQEEKLSGVLGKEQGLHLASDEKSEQELDLESLDTPAFLRKQAAGQQV